MLFRAPLFVSAACLAGFGCATAGNGTDDNVKLDAATHDSTSTGNHDAALHDSSIPSGNCSDAFSGVLASWTFSGMSGSQSETPVATMASGVTASGLDRSSAITASSTNNSMSATNWTKSSQVDTTKYFTFMVTPPSGCTMSLTSMALNASSSGTGPQSAAIATSDDSFSATSDATIGAASTPMLMVSSATGAVEVRIYGYDASSTSGTMHIETTLSVSGALQ